MEKIKRLAAIIMILIILGLVIFAFVLGITGSEYFAAALFLCVIVPVLFYGISLFTKLFTAKGKELAAEAERKNKAEQNDNTEQKSNAEQKNKAENNDVEK